MWVISTILLTVVTIIFITIYFRERSNSMKIRIGRRGGSVVGVEIEYNGNVRLAENIINYLRTSGHYHIYLVGSGIPNVVPNKTIDGKEFFLDRLSINNHEEFKLFEFFKDVSVFILNEDVDEPDKILLTHDLIVNAAQIPDRELLLESGFIISIISQSNIIVIIGLVGEFEKILFRVMEDAFSSNKKVVITKM